MRSVQFGTCFFLDPDFKAKTLRPQTYGRELVEGLAKLAPLQRDIMQKGREIRNLQEKMAAVADGADPSQVGNRPASISDKAPLAYVLEHPIFTMGHYLNGMAGINTLFRRLSGGPGSNAVPYEAMDPGNPIHLSPGEVAEEIRQTEQEYFQEFNPYEKQLKAQGYPTGPGIPPGSKGYVICADGSIEERQY